ncbi:MAG: amidohydrolase [Candidatus Eisenbacteria bacterium]|uniref:Amidohydrolase n=1 Tax=Eiseniibacteriota bacterium TaxID=2212470 RepID=A0A7Y2E9Z1_UNCEI|nr:amidohydrolase [Candidatus Eisenbacteria bacterium]
MKRQKLFSLATVVATACLVPSLVFGATAAGDPEAWHANTPDQPGAVLVQNATIWTSGPQGKFVGDLLIRNGKVAQVGTDLSAPSGAVVIDGTGKHVTPGLIDAHSHTAIVGGVNEGTNNVTSEVRIEDVVNSETVNIYRQLAGGLTAGNLLHGSANAIGGQNCLIKMRYGEDPEDLKVEGRMQGIKFALGENPKRANWGEQDDHYPITRSGVEQLIRERFTAAKDYKERWDRWNSSKKGTAPKRDFQLEALVEILDGKRQIHCHSYRADEILMLMRIADDMGFKVDTFQHVLEGYKVADEMREHGAMGSTFSDWWAYKFEVYDAIPYNGSIMWDRGVVTTFNSDSSELARRMNLEAAKAVKYGGIPEEEALKFVTLNAAKQMRVDDIMGSLEAGKDADFVIWNGHPLSTYSICEQTWVDGRKYFDREEDLAAREALLKEREALIAKIKDKKEEGKEPTVAGADDPGYQMPEYYYDSAETSVCKCAAVSHKEEECTHIEHQKEEK